LLRLLRSLLLQGELVEAPVQSLPSQVRLLRTVLRAVLPDAVLRPQVLPDAVLRSQVLRLLLRPQVLRLLLRLLRSLLLQGELVEAPLQPLPSQVRLLRAVL
jgi:hypothetical protein